MRQRRAAFNTVLPNPAWTNAALLRQWGDVQGLVGQAMMPKVDVHTATRLQAQEYGSGVYGTVMPTNKRDVVAKVTSDPSEARFAYVMSRWPKSKYPPGLVRYFKVYRLRGTHSTRPIFILWREEAYDVGNVLRSDSRTAGYLQRIRDSVDPSFWLTYEEDLRDRHRHAIVRGEQKYRHGGFFRRLSARFSEAEAAGYSIQAARGVASEMARGDRASLVGKAIRDLIDYGLVLADVHIGNIGLVRRGGHMRTVITDPGNVAFITTQYDSVFPPTVEEAIAGRRGHPRTRHGHSRRATVHARQVI